MPRRPGRSSCAPWTGSSRPSRWSRTTAARRVSAPAAVDFARPVRCASGGTPDAARPRGPAGAAWSRGGVVAGSGNLVARAGALLGLVDCLVDLLLVAETLLGLLAGLLDSLVDLLVVVVGEVLQIVQTGHARPPSWLGAAGRRLGNGHTRRPDRATGDCRGGGHWKDLGDERGRRAAGPADRGTDRRGAGAA